MRDLFLEKLHVGVPVGVVAGFGGGKLVVAALVGVVGVVPIGDGVVEAEGDAAGVAGVGEHGDDVALVRGVHHVEVGLLGVPEAEAVVVLGGEADVFHAGVLEDVEPGVGVAFGGVELVDKGLVLGAGDAAAPLFLLVPGVDGVEAPVDEEAEALLEEPVACVAEVGWHRI